MKQYKIPVLLSIALVVFALSSCEKPQEVADPISPDGYPVVTFTTDFSGTSVTEGDTIIYSISIDKMLDRQLRFAPIILDGTGDDHDIIYNEAAIAPYTTETELMIVFAADDYPEVAETMQIEIGLERLAEKYLVNPSTTNPVLDLTVNNYNDPSVLTIAFEWDGEDNDIDIVAGYVYNDTLWGWGYAASSDNPEILTSIWPDDPDGTYLVGLDPYHVEGSGFNYVVSIGYPDQSVGFFSGYFDLNSTGTYTYDYVYDYEWPVYRFLEVVNRGGTFTVTHALE
ncbi:MAG: hypothetical protein JXA77_07450 [Bacteroidales bacterium]|nr:hypothetical protein [Bacteroidales bacterium]MBN2819712.1 hypothetical protein [Bacteroidales bacterium]